MKPLGMIGGLGPESTVEYYKLLVAEYRERTRDDSYPPILINSVNLQKGRGLVEAQKYAELADFMVEEVERLARAGAGLGLYRRIRRTLCSMRFARGLRFRW